MLCETWCTSWDMGRCNCVGCGLGPVELVADVVWRWGLTIGYAGPILYGPGPSETGGPRLLWGVCNFKCLKEILTISVSYFNTVPSPLRALIKKTYFSRHSFWNLYSNKYTVIINRSSITDWKDLTVTISSLLQTILHIWKNFKLRKFNTEINGLATSKKTRIDNHEMGTKCQL